MALAEAEAAGILPLISVCNLSCLFCSNRSNPPGVRVFSLPPRSLSDIDQALGRMSHLGEVVVGESASRVSEGEPLTHPRFLEIIALVRRRLPRALLKITTNGALLTPDLAAALADLGPVEVTVSVNTLCPDASRRVHGREFDPSRAPRALAAAGIPYHASVVALPAVYGAGDLVRTARGLEDWGCLSCRVFTPGHTFLTPPETAGLMPTRGEVARLVAEARTGTGLPLTAEPPDIGDLSAVLAGVMRDTPADRAGLRAGDVLLEVEGRAPFSRVDAFGRCLAALRRTGRCRLEVAGRGEAAGGGEVVLEGAGTQPPPRPGFIMDHDVDPADIRLITRVGREAASGKALVLTSELGVRALTLALASVAMPAACRVIAVPSRTFGGSIACTGLLTVDDFKVVLLDLARRGEGPVPGEAVLLPPRAFGSAGLDLIGRSAAELGDLLPRGATLVAPTPPRA